MYLVNFAHVGSQEYKITWDDPLEESFKMAKMATSLNSLWWKGYFYAGRHCAVMPNRQSIDLMSQRIVMKMF